MRGFAKREIREFPFPSPIRGWETSGNLAEARTDAAERLDNLFPTAEGAEVRAGSQKHATASGAAIRLFRFLYGDVSELFVSTDTTVEAVLTPADIDTAETPILKGHSSGDWATTQFETGGGTYMVAVNGTDNAFYYDGTSAQPIVDTAVNDLAYDALTGEFAIGQTVTGGASGATATIVGIAPATATAGVLKVGTITGTFSDDEALTDPVSGAATSNIPSGTSEASAVAITGIETAKLSQVWLWGERQFFIEEGTMNAWYLPAESIGGAAVRLPLGPVFKKGGQLLFGANWSVDSGAGLDDKCVFVTDQGEVAVYGGTDPANADTWGIEGVYELGKPVSKHGSFSLGGELMIVTDDGIFPLSEAIFTSREELGFRALTRPIEADWQRYISQRSNQDPVNLAVWQSKGALYVSAPQSVDGLPATYVCNTRLRRWCRYLGWDMDCAVVVDNALYFANSDGDVFRGEQGGTDNGAAYTCHYVPKLNAMGTTAIKHASQVALIYRAPEKVTFAARIASDFQQKALPNPSPTSEPNGVTAWGDGSTWGDGSVWGATIELTGRQDWKSAGGRGLHLAPTISMTVNQTSRPSIEIIASMVRYERGSPI